MQNHVCWVAEIETQHSLTFYELPKGALQPTVLATLPTTSTKRRIGLGITASGQNSRTQNTCCLLPAQLKQQVWKTAVTAGAKTPAQPNSVLLEMHNYGAPAASLRYWHTHA